MSSVRVPVSKEFLEDVLRHAPAQGLVIYAELDGREVKLVGHVEHDPADETFTFALETLPQ